MHGEGDLGKFLDANGIKWHEASGAVASTNELLYIAAGLVARANHDAGGFGDALKAAGKFGFSREFTEMLTQGPGKIRDLGMEFERSGAMLQKDVIDKADEFDKQWTAASVKWGNAFKEVVVSVTPYLNSLIDKLGEGLSLAASVVKDVAKGNVRPPAAEKDAHPDRLRRAHG